MMTPLSFGNKTDKAVLYIARKSQQAPPTSRSAANQKKSFLSGPRAF